MLPLRPVDGAAPRPVQCDESHAVALEPMTCPPDAFNSGADLIMLSQEPVTVGWQVRAL